MSEHEDFYTPERIDEQVDALLQARGMSLQDQRLASDLQSMLTQTDEDAYSLQRVLHKLVEEDAPKQRKIISLAGLDTQQQGRFVAMPETPKKLDKTRRITPLWRALGTLAAVLVAALLVGSMLFTLNATRQKAAVPTTTHTGAAHQNTSAAREGQLVYTSQFGGSTAAWSPDGSRVAVSTTNKGGVKSWDALTGQHVLNYVTDGDAYENSLGGENMGIVNIAWSPDGTKLAVAGYLKIYLFDARTAKLLKSWPVPTGNAASLFAVLGGSHGMVPLSSEISLSGTQAEFENVAWSPDGKDLATAFNDPGGSQNVVYVWNASTYAPVKTLTGFHGTVLNVAWSSNGKWLSTLAYPAQRGAGMTPVAQLWDTSTWQPGPQYTNVANLAWSPDGTKLALVDAYGGVMGGNGKDARIIDVLTGKTVVQPFGGSSTTMITNISWSPDGSRIALEQQPLPGVKSPVKVTLWSATSGTQTYSFSGNFSIYDAAWSPDGKYLSTTENNAEEASNVVIWKA